MLLLSSMGEMDRKKAKKHAKTHSQSSFHILHMPMSRSMPSRILDTIIHAFLSMELNGKIYKTISKELYLPQNCKIMEMVKCEMCGREVLEEEIVKIEEEK